MRLASFIKAAWEVVEPGNALHFPWFLHRLAAVAEDVAAGRQRRVIVNVPPGHMKSLLWTVFLPAFVWLTHPGKRFLTCSHDEDLRKRDGRRLLQLLQSDWYKALAPHVLITPDPGVLIFSNTMGGEVRGVTVSGKGLGNHPDYVIGDDLNKVSDANSKAAQDKAIECWSGVLGTRARDPLTVARINIQQRICELDVTGYILSQENQGGYTHVCYPARYEAGRAPACPLDDRREDGSLLWPERVPETELARIETELGHLGTASMLQQRPAPAGGNVIKTEWLEEYQTLPTSFRRMCMAVDPTGSSTSKTADQCAIQVWGHGEDGRYYLVYSWMARADFIQQLQAIRATVALYPQCTTRLIENKAAGLSLIQLLQKEAAWITVDPGRESKGQRLAACAPLFEAKRVVFPAKSVAAFDVEAVKTQLTGYPTARHDDAVDACTYALARLQDSTGDLDTAMRRFRAMGIGSVSWLSGFNRY
jgi:predicted phage terminase large subunit-like protein